MRSIDLNEYAEANEMVVVYPQAAGSPHIGPGCWNWASFRDDPSFDTQDGIQLGVVHAMIDDLPNALAHATVTDGSGASEDEDELPAALHAPGLPTNLTAVLF